MPTGREGRGACKSNTDRCAEEERPPDFFSFNESEWLRPSSEEEHVSRHRTKRLECDRGTRSPHRSCAHAEQSTLGRLWWWPFHTISFKHAPFKRTSGAQPVHAHVCSSSRINSSVEHIARLWNISLAATEGSGQVWKRKGVKWVKAAPVTGQRQRANTTRQKGIRVRTTPTRLDPDAVHVHK